MTIGAIALKVKTGVIVFFDKLAVTAFSAGAGTYLADHSKGITETAALKAAGVAAAVAALIFASNAAKNYLAKTQ